MPSSMSVFITRFAPSPTGLLHLGHAFSALTAHDAARRADGRLLLRIEDIDAARCRPEYEAAIFEDLAWLGLDWETPVRRQSEHLADYAAALDRLISMGVVYRCFRTRKEVLAEIARAPHLTPAGPEGPAFVGSPLPAAEERALIEAGEPYAWRLSMRAARECLGPAWEGLEIVIEDEPENPVRSKASPEIFGDAVIARKDAGASYHLASVHDDAMQEITHVIRGADLAPAAHLHRLLQALLGWPAPVWRHHRLITDESGRRLAKRDRAATLRALREAGATPKDVRARLGLADAF